MFDDLRNNADDQANFVEDSDAELEAFLKKKPRSPGLKLNFNFTNNTFLGMNSFQRFIISALLFVLVCIIGSMLLMISSTSPLF